MAQDIDYLLVNFGGPRDLEEIEPFLEELLLDPDVVKTKYPTFFHNFLFRKIAKRRAVKIAHDYALIGGKSPIYFDTETLANALSSQLKIAVHTFHRYLPATHKYSIDKLEKSEAKEIRVLPLFPQFSFATTGSIARRLTEKLSPKTLKKLRWIQSYAESPPYILSFQRRIREFLEKEDLSEENTTLFFSAHGLPAAFVSSGDPYATECTNSFRAIRSAFPNALTLLAYQSKFGRGEWLRPYTSEMAEKALSWCEGRPNVVFIPLSFTSDHVETLFEVEYQYLPLIRAQNLNAYRCPALNLEPYWVAALSKLFADGPLAFTHDLFR